MKKFLISFILIIALAFSTSAHGISWGDLGEPFDMCDTGAWYEPATSGHGMSIVVSDTVHEGRPNILLFWYTYDKYGLPFWFIAEGERDGDWSNQLMLNMWISFGIAPPDFNNENSQIFDAGNAFLLKLTNGNLEFTYEPNQYGREAGHGNYTVELEKLFIACD